MATFAQVGIGTGNGLVIPETPDLVRMRRETGARLRSAMAERGVDAMILLGNNAVVYATGTSWPLGDAGLSYVERPVAVVLADDEWPHLFLPFREGASLESDLPDDHLHGPVYLEFDEGVQNFARVLADLVAPGAAVAVDECTGAMSRAGKLLFPNGAPSDAASHRRHNPGRAAVIAVALLIVIYTFSQVGLQGVVSPAKLKANSSSVLVYIAQALGGGGGAKVMALALALSVIASTGVSIVILARMIYGMASHRVLPPVLGLVSPRFATPAVASVVVGLILIAVTWVYLLSSSIANAFTQLIDLTGVLYASFYILTALSAIVYYRRRVFSNAWDAVLVGILPVAAAGFLTWIVVKSTQNAAASQKWSLIGIVGAGVILMFVARFVLRSPFFQIPRESAAKER